MPSLSVSDIAVQSGITGSASTGVVVVPNDTNLIGDYRAIWVGGLGNVAVEWFDGTQMIFTAVPAGTLLPIRVAKIRSTGTTATNMVAIQ